MSEEYNLEKVKSVTGEFMDYDVIGEFIDYDTKLQSNRNEKITKFKSDNKNNFSIEEEDGEFYNALYTNNIEFEFSNGEKYVLGIKCHFTSDYFGESYEITDLHIQYLESKNSKDEDSDELDSDGKYDEIENEIENNHIKPFVKEYGSFFDEYFTEVEEFWLNKDYIPDFDGDEVNVSGNGYKITFNINYYNDISDFEIEKDDEDDEDEEN